MLVACINEDECKSEHVNNFSSLTWTYFLCPHRNVGIPDHCHRRRRSNLWKQCQDRLQHSPRAAFLHRRPQNWYAKTSLSTNNLIFGHFEMPSTVESCTWLFSDCSCELVRSHQWVSHSTIIGCRKQIHFLCKTAFRLTKELPIYCPMWRIIDGFSHCWGPFIHVVSTFELMLFSTKTEGKNPSRPVPKCVFCRRDFS